MGSGGSDLRRADVAVVGAGPSGAWCARTLARRGARVLLVDPSHPREKPCGGGVTGRALALVSAALQGRSLPACVIRTARFLDSASGSSASLELRTGDGLARSTGDGLPRGLPSSTHASAAPDPSPTPGLLVVSRTAFDGALLTAAREAGVELLSSRVTDVATVGGGFRIQTEAGTLEALHVIGADGANSLVRRRLARPFRRDQLSIATGCFAHGVTSDEIVIELVTDPPGYIWSFPRPTHLAIGICAQADSGVTAAALRARVVDWIHSTGIAPHARLEPYSWPIPSLSAADFDAPAVSGPGWLLVGDAAGLVDPITREGISFALLSGEWAGDAIASGGDDPFRRYADRVRDEIGIELAGAARFKAGFFHPRFTRLMMEAVAESAPIRSVVADLIAGRQPYGTLKWRLLKTFEVGLAVKLAAARYATVGHAGVNIRKPTR